MQRFRSLDPTGKGSGLGLAISRGVVQLHNGRIWAENLPGGGAAFRVELRATTEDSEPLSADSLLPGES